MALSDDPQLTSQRMADLSALADGSLPESRRAEVEAFVARSPALAEALAEQRRVVALLHEVRAADGAPARLHAAVRAARRRRTPALNARWPALGAAAALAIAAFVVVVIAVGGAGPPTVAQAATLAARGPTAAAPSPDPDAPARRLQQSVEDVYFPNWTHRLGWRATGQRSDNLGDRRAVTVYYASWGQVLAYTILTRPALPEPSGQAFTVAGTRMFLVTVGGRTVVTWRRAGHTCVLSARGVLPRTLEQLAAWTTTARD